MQLVGRKPDSAKPTSRPRFRACITSRLGRAEACEGGLGGRKKSQSLLVRSAPGLSHCGSAIDLFLSKGGGFIAVVGLLGGTETTIDQLTFIVRNARVESLTVGSRESFEKMNEFLVANELHPIVGAVFPWSKTAEAFRELEVGKHFGKIVLRRE